MTNCLLKIKDRLKNLNNDEKEIIKMIVSAFDDAIKYQEFEIEFIHLSPFLPSSEIKSDTLNDRLTIQKSYEQLMAYFKSILNGTEFIDEYNP